MSDNQNALYEGLFLMNNAMIGSDLTKAVQFVRGILDRASAEVDSISKWDDRRLAYDIKGQKRGLYLLAYFHVSGGQIANIERDVTLSEQALRCMIIRADHVGEAELQLAREKDAETSDAANLTSTKADEPASEPAEAPTQPQPAAEAPSDGEQTDES